MKDLSQCRILIVDDVKANVDVLVQALRNDYSLSVALSGESALRSIEKTPPDLVLLDILMPGMDGYEVCRRLRASALTREVPVMFLSSLEDVQDKTRGFEVGGNDYLTKPCETLEVTARVRSLLKAKAYTDAVKEQMASELRIAREIQLGILPSDISSSIRQAHLDIHVEVEPARQVGGDLHEVILGEDGRVLVVVGDVSGKGIPAALFMAVTMTLLRSMARLLSHPEEIIRLVNDELERHNPRHMFVTLACALFEPGSSRVIYASAGHPSPILIRPGKAPTPPCKTASMVAGIFPGIKVEKEEIEVQPGETLLFYTDGVTEAFNEAREMFGEEGLIDQLTRKPGTTASETVASVMEAVRRHVGQHPQSDDITVLAVRSLPMEQTAPDLSPE